MSTERSKYECKDFKDIAKCFERLHNHIETEIVAIKFEHGELTKRVDVVENQVEFFNAEFQDLHNKLIPNLEAQLDAERNERIKLEMWGRKWNLIIRGIKGRPDAREIPKTTNKLVREFLEKTLGMQKERVNTMLFTAVHRLPSRDPKNQNIILRLSDLIDRDDILQAALKLEPGSGYSVVPDLPPGLARLRGELLKTRREMSPEKKKRTKLVYLKESPFLKLHTKTS